MYTSNKADFPWFSISKMSPLNDDRAGNRSKWIVNKSNKNLFKKFITSNFIYLYIHELACHSF